MVNHKVVPNNQRRTARKELFVKEKEFSRLRGELSQLRRNLPWEKVEKEYVFDGPSGEETLSELFESRSQLIIYHFMFDPEWNEGCKSCSYLADHYNPAIVHLNHRDFTMVTVSRAPLSKLDTFKKRMAWSFNWVSAYGNDFNWDYHVSFNAADVTKKQVYYNYHIQSFPEGPGISVFCKDESGAVFHTYSSFSQGSTYSSSRTICWTSCPKVAMSRDSRTA
jgi:predicted dithiol-disulfide oxidoreductase (DUF899 family)